MQNMKKRRKTSYCLNCGLDLDPAVNYCPRCGQENTDNNVSFGTLAGDFISNYFSLDGRLGRSVLPFLLKPGRLTNEFIQGRRKTFMHPVRIYLVISLIFFTVFTLFVTSQMDENDKVINLTDNDTSGEVVFTATDEEGNKVSRKIFGNKNDTTAASDTVELPYINDSILNREIGAIMNDSLADNEGTARKGIKTDSGFSILNDDQFELIYKLAKNYNLTEEEILDSAKVEEGTSGYWIAKKTIRLNRAENKSITAYILKNIPIMMFFLMPIFALILKLLYARRTSLYIHHLVHALHLHSFTFIVLLLMITVIWTEFFAGPLVTMLMITLGIYILWSFKNVYKQGYIKTVLKVMLAIGFYSFFFGIALLIELLLSLAFY